MPVDSGGRHPLPPVTPPAGGETARLRRAGRLPLRGDGELLARHRFSHNIHRVLLLADLSALALAGFGAATVAEALGRPVNGQDWYTALVVMAPAWILIAHYMGLFHMAERRVDYDYVDDLGPVTIGVTAWIWLLTVATSLLFPDPGDLTAPLVLWGLAIPSVMLARAAARAFSKERDWFRRPVALVGDGEGIAALRERIYRHPEWGLEPKLEAIGGADLGRTGSLSLQGDSSLGSPPIEVRLASDPASEADGGGGTESRRLAQAVQGSGINHVLIAGLDAGLSSTTQLIQEMVDRGISVDYVSAGSETLYSSATLQHLEGLPVMTVRPTYPGPASALLKRVFDVAVAGAGLLVLSPVLAWAAIRIKLDSKGPVLYRQRRCGHMGEPFELVKLRTMVDGAHSMREELRKETEQEGNDDVLFKLEDDPRITRFGHALRRWSLDELPQLWNVVKGDMSMVGPRPLVFEEAEKATDLFAARSRVKPGIAGPWQSLGRSQIPFEDMVRLDYTYVVGWSASEDVRLLLRTVSAVLRRRGAC